MTQEFNYKIEKFLCSVEEEELAYEMGLDGKFILEKPQTFNVMGKSYQTDHIRCEFDEEGFNFDYSFEGYTSPYGFNRIAREHFEEIKRIFAEEQKAGLLTGWRQNDELNKALEEYGEQYEESVEPINIKYSYLQSVIYGTRNDQTGGHFQEYDRSFNRLEEESDEDDDDFELEFEFEDRDKFERKTDFLLDKPYVFSLLGEHIVIDRIRVSYLFDATPDLYYANSQDYFNRFTISETHLKQIKQMIEEGKQAGYRFGPNIERAAESAMKANGYVIENDGLFTREEIESKLNELYDYYEFHSEDEHNFYFKSEENEEYLKVRKLDSAVHSSCNLNGQWEWEYDLNLFKVERD